MDSYEDISRILDLQNNTGYILTQENGQRRLMAPEILSGEHERVKGAEVFLGGLPRDLYEWELMPVLQKVGRLLELRLMLDFSGSTRGYAFALFKDQRVARQACNQLNGYPIRPGYNIGVVKSLDNCRLFFGGVPKIKTKDEFLHELSKILDGITTIHIYPNPEDRTLNRGFMFVEFENHRAAAMARRKLVPGKVTLWKHDILVDWADPEPGDPVDDDTMLMVTALFIRNLSWDLSQQKLRDIFLKHTNVPILKLKKIQHYAFIHYENRTSAQTVKDIMERPNSIVKKEGWELTWAKPIGAAKVSEREKHIREAEANPHFLYIDEPHNAQRTSQRRVEKKKQKKKYCKKATVQRCEEQECEINSVFLAQSKTLQNYIKEMFNATCAFECIPVWNSSNYIGKITIYRNEEVLMQFIGDNPVASKKEAMDETYLKLYQYFENDALLQQLPSQKYSLQQYAPTSTYQLQQYTAYQLQQYASTSTYQPQQYVSTSTYRPRQYAEPREYQQPQQYVELQQYAQLQIQLEDQLQNYIQFQCQLPTEDDNFTRDIGSSFARNY